MELGEPHGKDKKRSLMDHWERKRQKCGQASHSKEEREQISYAKQDLMLKKKFKSFNHSGNGTEKL